MCRGALLGLYAPVDFFAMDADVGRGLDAEANLIAVNAKDGDGDLVANVQRFLRMAVQDKHAAWRSGRWLHDAFPGALVGTRV
ncbi:Uncharacterised protein [Burkholderia pseudomallei]|nr:Uncharacterised protein [Burkholderia pseudomallei]